MKSLYYLLIAISRTLHLVCVTTECIALTLLITLGFRPNEFVMSGVREYSAIGWTVYTDQRICLPCVTGLIMGKIVSLEVSLIVACE